MPASSYRPSQTTSPIASTTCRYSLSRGSSPTCAARRALYAEMRTRLPASSSRSIALSGRKRSAMYFELRRTAASTLASLYTQRWWRAYRAVRPRRIASASASLGSSTLTGWKRRSSAASFSTYLRYSSIVVAPMTWNSPRASAGLMRLAMSMPPLPPPLPAEPAPTSVCTSSIMRMTLPSARTSPMSFVMRCSSSPRSLAPAMTSPTSSCSTRFWCRNAGSGLPSGLARCTIAVARPSAIAVLPTPGSPSRMGLFLVRRPRICVTRCTSRARPITGSMRPALTSATRSLQYSSSMRRAPSLAAAPPTLAFFFFAPSETSDSALRR
mmetsp:Transcript_38023/g.112568  ORF Transcript_38023/g.112568 Transcript_38023/m.112568 type:complete len:326 (-) Transcript_38023:857-1834(-)